jgi:hypothetical protein
LGTQTFWVDRRVIDQATDAYDLLANHARVYTAIIGLWLSGYPVELAIVRRSYLSLIDSNSVWQHRRTKPREAEDAISELIPRVANRLLRPRSPAEIKNELTDLLLPFVTSFFDLDEDDPIEGLAFNWATARPYLLNQSPTPFDFSDQQLQWFKDRLSDWASLPRQRDTIQTVDDHDLVRARRMVHLALGTLWRNTPQASRPDLEGLRSPH